MSKFAGHSLGPWSREGWLILDGYGVSVCRVKPWDSSGCRIDDNADAELIAAAPDLLAERDRLREALEKANAKITEIKEALYGQGFRIIGFHLNGDTEAMDSWFEENDWEPERMETDDE